MTKRTTPIFSGCMLTISWQAHSALTRLPRNNRTFPRSKSFPEYLQPELDAGKVLIDSTCFVADERLSRLYRGLPYATLRLCVLAAEYFRADYLLAAVWKDTSRFIGAPSIYS